MLDQFSLIRDHQRRQLAVHPLAADQVARIGQIRLGFPIPPDLIAMHVAAAVRILERILLAGHFHPADTNLDLRRVSIATRRVGLGMALGLIQPVVQRISHVIVLLVAVGDDAPIGARLRLHTQYGINRWPNQRLNGRR